MCVYAKRSLVSDTPYRACEVIDFQKTHLSDESDHSAHCALRCISITMGKKIIKDLDEEKSSHYRFIENHYNTLYWMGTKCENVMD